jgi:small GTP-binding protein
MSDAAESNKAGPEFKIVFVGDSSVGKTSLILWYCNHTFAEDRQPTIGSAFLSRPVKTQYGPANLQIWDTAGQERYRSLVPMYSRGAVVAVIAFDLSARETFDDVEMWIAEVRTNVSQNCAIVIAGNKCDLPHNQLSRDEVERWAEHQTLPIVFVSAKTGENVDLLFSAVIEHLPTAAFGLAAADDVDIDTDKRAKKKGCCFIT